MHTEYLGQVLITYAQMPLIKAYADIPSKARCLNFGPSLHLHPSFVFCMRAAKAVVSLHLCTDLPEPSLFADVISTEISCTDPFIELIKKL